MYYNKVENIIVVNIFASTQPTGLIVYKACLHIVYSIWLQNIFFIFSIFDEILTKC